MKIYQVGGAVRDQRLGLTVQDRDWVVVGATAQELLDQGFKPVGKDFPVFLHPQTGEEYALARTERKSAPGYKGFTVHADPDVTLEEDLRRRDLTINAMALNEHGRLIDPFGGQQDLQRKILRHVSPAFAEDPVRILRVARFYARYAAMGFAIAADTMALMTQIVTAGEVDALVPERVWAETHKALSESQPWQFFNALRQCGALARLFPEIDALFGVPQPAEHHPEIDTGVHTLMVLEQACRISPSPKIRFAALLHDLGKGSTPPSQWPRHIDHETRSVTLVRDLCQRLRTPNEFRDLAVLVAKYHGKCHRALELRPATLLDLLTGMDALRRPGRFEDALLACMADCRGRTGFEETPYPQADRLRQARRAALTVDAATLAAQGLKGPKLAERLRQLRIAAIVAARKTLTRP